MFLKFPITFLKLNRILNIILLQKGNKRTENESIKKKRGQRELNGYMEEYQTLEQLTNHSFQLPTL